MGSEVSEPKGLHYKRNQLLVNTTFLFIHVAMFFMFTYFHVYMMTFVNLVSITSYLVGYYYIYHNRYMIVFYITYFEVLLHLVLATIAVGTQCGFWILGTALTPYIYFTEKGFIAGPGVKHIKHPIAYQCLAVFGIIFSYIWSYLKGSIYSIDSSVALGCMIVLLIVLMATLGLVMNYFIYQIQEMEAQLIQQKDMFSDLSKHDALTGLRNRRSIEDHFNRAITEKRDFCVIMCDIDDFKKINDTYGHSCGDYVLKHISQMMKQAVRKRDIVCRWGGEEILIYLPECPMFRAKEIAENLRRNISEEHFEYDEQKLQLSMTFGVTKSKKGEELEEIVKRVDEYLYKGKAAGKNCVIFE